MLIKFKLILFINKVYIKKLLMVNYIIIYNKKKFKLEKK